MFGELEEDLKVMVGHFPKVYRSFRVNGDKSKVIVLDDEEGLK